MRDAAALWVWLSGYSRTAPQHLAPPLRRACSPRTPAPPRQLYNNFALGHIMYSDDGGDSWALASRSGFGGGVQGASLGANEDQLVQLSNGSVLVNSRSLSTGSPQRRVQALSRDGGLTFTPTRFVDELPEPFNGCQGSLVASAAPADGALFFSHPNPARNSGIAPAILRLVGAQVNLTGRDHMSLWKSTDDGASYQLLRLIDGGASGYSSLQAVPPAAADRRAPDGRSRNASSSLWLLYEQSDREATSLGHLGAQALIGALSVLNPDRLVLRLIEGV